MIECTFSWGKKKIIMILYRWYGCVLLECGKLPAALLTIQDSSTHDSRIYGNANAHDRENDKSITVSRTGTQTPKSTKKALGLLGRRSWSFSPPEPLVLKGDASDLNESDVLSPGKFTNPVVTSPARSGIPWPGMAEIPAGSFAAALDVALSVLLKGVMLHKQHSRNGWHERFFRLRIDRSHLDWGKTNTIATNPQKRKSVFVNDIVGAHLAERPLKESNRGRQFVIKVTTRDPLQLIAPSEQMCNMVIAAITALIR